MVRVIEIFSNATSLPIVAKPNAGKPVPMQSGVAYSMDPLVFAETAEACVRAGARLIGGCCGTTAEHIRATEDRLRELGIKMVTSKAAS